MTKSEESGADSGRGRRRIAFVNTHPIQYFAPLYRYINSNSTLIEAVPVYLTDFSLRGAVDDGFGQPVIWDVDLLSGTNPIFVKGAETRALEAGLTKMIVPDLWRVIRTGNFDAVVVHGHRLGANYVAWAAAKTRGLPVLTRGDMHLDLPNSRLKNLSRDVLMPLLFKIFDGFLAIGTANAEYYRHMGAAEPRIIHFPFSVDNDRIIASAQLTPEQRSAERAKLGIAPDRFALLFAAKFNRNKHADALIRAAVELAARGTMIDLVLAGSGDMDVELRALAAQHPHLNIVFPGFVNQAALPHLLATCDAFVLPAENERWGLAINEAMCAALPIIVTREVGCVRDLVREGVNGALCDANDDAGLIDAISRVIADWSGPRTMGKNSFAIVQEWDYRACLNGLEAGLARISV